MATQIQSGRVPIILNFNLTDTYADVSFSRAIKSFIMQARNGSKIMIRIDSSQSAEWTIFERIPFSVDGQLNARDETANVPFQAKCADAGGTDVLEVWGWI